MDNITTKDVVLDKKLDGYGNYSHDNFVASQEITVTITLNEYRDLISSKATKQYAIDEANKDRYTRNAENEKLQKENQSLRAELYELKKKFDAMQEEMNAGSDS